jgi:hypothetical protein
MNRTFGRFLVLGLVALAASVGDQSTSQADWPWWDGYPTYSYGAGYYPYGTPYSTNYWPSSYYVGYGSYSLYPSYAWPGCGCGSSCGASSCCASSYCGSSCGGCSSGCCGLGGCGYSGCGTACGSGCGFACGPSCCGVGGCGTGGAGCGATDLAPGAKAKPVPEPKFEPRTYDPDAPVPRPGSTERSPRPASPNGLGGPPAAGDPDAGAKPYSRDRSGDGATKPPAGAVPKDKDELFNTPVTKPAGPPSAATPKEVDPTFGNTEAKKPLVPVPQKGTDKKAPISAPDEAGAPDATPSKAKTELKKSSAENRSDEQPQREGSALTLQDRSTWHLSGLSRPLFGQIAQTAAPLPERLSPMTGDWAVFSADEALIVRR